MLLLWIAGLAQAGAFDAPLADDGVWLGARGGGPAVRFALGDGLAFDLSAGLSVFEYGGSELLAGDSRSASLGAALRKVVREEGPVSIVVEGGLSVTGSATDVGLGGVASGQTLGLYGGGGVQLAVVPNVSFTADLSLLSLSMGLPNQDRGADATFSGGLGYGPRFGVFVRL